jgi:hypothetical protein
LVADDADDAGDFAADADQLAAMFIQAPFIARSIYYAPPAMTVTDTQQAILARWNAGAGLVLYQGHSSVRQWAAERLFHRDDVAALRNAGQLPVALQMSCLTGLFHEPNGTTLDETLRRAARLPSGAQRVWASPPAITSWRKVSWLRLCSARTGPSARQRSPASWHWWRAVRAPSTCWTHSPCWVTQPRI